MKASNESTANRSIVEDESRADERIRAAVICKVHGAQCLGSGKKPGQGAVCILPTEANEDSLSPTRARVGCQTVTPSTVAPCLPAPDIFLRYPAAGLTMTAGECTRSEDLTEPDSSSDSSLWAGLGDASTDAGSVSPKGSTEAVTESLQVLCNVSIFDDDRYSISRSIAGNHELRFLLP